MNEGKNSHVSLARNVSSSVTFGNASLYIKLMELVLASYPANNACDYYMSDIFEFNLNPCFNNVLDAELRRKLA